VTSEPKPTQLDFSFILHTANLGDRTRHVINPFTQATLDVPIDHGFTANEAAEMAGFLASRGFTGPEPHGEGFVLRHAARDSLRLRFGQFEGPAPGVVSVGAELVVKRLDDGVLGILLELACVANCAFMSSTGKHVRLPKSRVRETLLSRWPQLRSLESVQDLREWLENDIAARKVSVLEPNAN
jgi:hypothetical protein